MISAEAIIAVIILSNIFLLCCLGLILWLVMQKYFPRSAIIQDEENSLPPYSTSNNSTSVESELPKYER